MIYIADIYRSNPAFTMVRCLFSRPGCIYYDGSKYLERRVGGGRHIDSGVAIYRPTDGLVCGCSWSVLALSLAARACVCVSMYVSSSADCCPVVSY